MNPLGSLDLYDLLEAKSQAETEFAIIGRQSLFLCNAHPIETLVSFRGERGQHFSTPLFTDDIARGLARQAAKRARQVRLYGAEILRRS